MKSLAIAFVLFLFAAPCFGQYGYRADRYELGSRSSSYERYGERYSMNPPRLYSGGTYLGQLSSDRYARLCVEPLWQVRQQVQPRQREQSL